MKILIVEDETAAYENLADMILSLDSSIVGWFRFRDL